MVSFFLSMFFSANAQDLSNRGKEFWLGYGHNNLFSNGNGQQLVLYLSTEQAATVTVSVNNSSWTRTYIIPANSVRQTDELPKSGTDDARIQMEGYNTRGIRIVSDVPIVAYAHQYGSNSSGATMLMPVETFGYTYYSLNYAQQSNSTPAYSWFFIVASEDNTKVEITPSVNTQNGQAANTTFTVDLNRGQIYNVFGQSSGLSGQDLTGSKIKSVSGPDNKCHPIGVFSGASRMVICGSSGEFMQQQIFPATAWGTRYLTYSTVRTDNINLSNTNYYRIAVRDPSTVVKRNGTQLTGLVNNFYYEFASNTGDFIESDKPILVGQYVPSQQACSVYSGLGDPEMFFLSPIEQAINKAIFYVSSNQSISTNYVSIIVKSTGLASLRIDGTTIWNTSIVHPANSNYRVITKILTPNQQHTILCDSAFTAITYGFGNVESYGYNAGTNLNNLDAVTTIQNTLSQVGGTNSFTCPNSPFQFSIKLSYKPTQMIWKFSKVSQISPNADTTLNNPVPVDSSFINGRTFYHYNLPNNYSLNDTGTFNIPITIFSPLIDNCNNSVDVVYPLKVNAPPKADFTFNYTGCKSDTAYLFGNSLPGSFNVTRYKWTFPNGTTDTLKDTKIVFPTQGSHAVKLTVIAANGCLGDTIKQVITSPPPIATFGMTPSQSCGPATVTFSDTSSYSGGSITNWYWDFGNGQTLNTGTNASQTQTYNTTGSYLIQHFAQSGSCLGDTTKKILNIYANPVAKFGFTIGCLQDSTVQFYDSSSVSDSQPLTYAWNFGDANANAGNPNTSTLKNPTHRYSAYATYQVSLTVTTASGGCTSTFTKPYTVTGFAAPINYLVENESTLCAQSQVKLTNQMNIAADSVYRIDIIWDFVNQPTIIVTDNTPTPNEIYLNQYPNFTTPLTKSVTIKWIVYSKGGCVSEKTKVIVLNATPAVTFSAINNICQGTGLASVANATVTNGAPGNGVYSGPGTDAAGNFNPAIAGVGNHTIKYVFTTTAGCKDSASTSFSVFAKPNAKWGYALLCDSTRFLDSSSISTGSITSWNWNYGNGNSSIKNNASPFSYLYPAAGTFDASLFVTSNNGCKSDTITKSITISALPVPAFTISNENALCSKSSVQITNTTNPGADTVKRIDIYWDFTNQPAAFDVDNSPAINKQYTHLYPSFTAPATKTITIKVKVYSRNGCTTETTKTITLHALPVLAFSKMSGVCITATNASVAQASVTNGVAGNGIYSGNGVAANGSFDPTVTGPGITTVKYIFTTVGGCIDSISQTINVFPKPVARWGYSNACVNDSTSFSDTSTISSGSIVSRMWNFGDGTNTNRANGATFKKLYSNFGNFTVTMFAISDSGCQSDPVTKQVTVHALPIPDFTMPVSACLPDASVLFTNTSSLPNGNVSSLNYVWNFGDPNANASNPNSSANTNPTHTYSDSARYLIRLSATSAVGCFKDTIKSFNAFYKKPIALFAVSAAAICQGTETVFYDSSTAPGSTINKWLWSFGDGSTSTIKNPKKTYASPGNFNIRLTVTTPQGCSKDTLQTVKVFLQPKVDAGPTLLVAEGSSIQLQPIVNDTTLRFLWTPAIYLNSDTLLKPMAIFPQFSTVYKLTATGLGNCTASDTMRLTVLKNLKIPNAFSPNGDGINDYWNIPFLFDYPGNVVDIFNRYGQRVYTISNYSKPWDGTINGKPLPVGVYYYIIDLKQPGYNRVSGSITLLK